MRYHLEVDYSDVEVVRLLYDKFITHPFVLARIERNLTIPAPKLSKELIWQTQIMCLVTTQNRSGAGSTVDNFLNLKPFPLSFQKCEGVDDVDKLIEDTFSQLRIRRWKISAELAKQNYSKLKTGGWNVLEKWQEQLLAQREKEPVPSHYILEREASQDVQKLIRGLGPKQSRNFWQDLGLTRYEIPLDSRINGWLNNRIDFYIPSSGLSDEKFYCQIMDSVHELALKAELLPCILDALIFASYEKE